MTTELSPEAARAAWDAELKLLQLDNHEWLAQFHEQEENAYLRAQFADRYRKAVGVVPALRDEFREALLRICDGGGVPVSDVIEVLNRR